MRVGKTSSPAPYPFPPAMVATWYALRPYPSLRPKKRPTFVLDCLVTENNAEQKGSIKSYVP